MQEPIIIDKLVEFHDGERPGELIINHTQEIPQSYLDSLQIAKAETIGTPMGDLHRVCSIPTGAYEEMQRSGFNPEDDIHETLRWMRKYELDKFITTTKRI